VRPVVRAPRRGAELGIYRVPHLLCAGTPGVFYPLLSSLTEICLCRTCSCHEILRMETPGQVGGDTDDAAIAAQLASCIRLLPHDNGTDGAFVAVFRKGQTASALRAEPNSSSNGEAGVPPSSGVGIGSSAEQGQRSSLQRQRRAQQCASGRGAFSVPESIRAALLHGVSPLIAAADTRDWVDVARYFYGGADVVPAGLHFLGAKVLAQISTAPPGAGAAKPSTSSEEDRRRQCHREDRVSPCRYFACNTCVRSLVPSPRHNDHGRRNPGLTEVYLWVRVKIMGLIIMRTD
jgi:hypothetical protein